MLQDFDPLFTLLAGAASTAILLAPVILKLRSDARDATSERRRYATLARRTRDILAASPDGIFLWDHGTGGISCSSRLAEMLELKAGTLARYDDIRDAFTEPSLQRLEQNVSLLRAKGTPFDILLQQGDKTFQAIGIRAFGDTGNGVADIIWLREPPEAAAPAARNASGLEDRHLTALLDTLPIPLWLRDQNLEIAFTNRAADRVSGLDAALAERARETASPVSGNAEIADGIGQKTMRITETPLNPEAAGRQSGTIGFAVDVPGSSTATAPAASQNPGALPTDILRPLQVGVAVFDADTALIAANSAFADLWRVDPDWLETRPGMNDLLVRLRELRRLPEVADFAAFRRTEIGRFAGLDRIVEDELHLPDGRTVHRRIGPLEGGGLVMACEDLSGRLDLQRSLTSLDRVQRTTLENLREGIAVFAGDGRLRLINPQLIRHWDLDENAIAPEARLADVIDTLGTRLIADGTPWPERRETIAARMLARTPSTGKLELINGRVLAFANVPLPDGASLISYADITDSHKVEEALRERARMLAETDRMKTEFIANVAMEVRTPLNTITGFADILRQEMFGELNDRQMQYAESILTTANQMMGVVKDILDLATIEAGRMELQRDTIDLHAHLVGVLKLVRERAHQKNIEIKFDCPPDIGFINADPQRLTQAVYNVLGNAVTFTPKLGHIGLTATRDGDWVEIQISDSGPGIPQAERERMLAPFEQMRDEAHRSDGAGLGLTIVRRFVELHGGGVMIRSNKSRGTTVAVRLPVDGENASGVAPFGTDRAILDDRAAE